MSDIPEPQQVFGHGRTDMEIRALYECLCTVIDVVKMHNCPNLTYSTYHQLNGAKRMIKRALNIEEQIVPNEGLK